MTSYSSHKYPTIDGNPEVLDGTTYPSERASVLLVPPVPLSPSRSRTRATHVITQSPGRTPDADSKPVVRKPVRYSIDKRAGGAGSSDSSVLSRNVAQPIHARIVEPVYAFDRIVIPVGSEVTGEVKKIGAISGGKRTLAALDADFTPLRTVEVGFDNLRLADGRQFPLQTKVAPGSGQVIRFVAAAEGKDGKKGVRDAASQKTKEAKERARQEWDNAMSQLKTPGRVHRLKRYVEAQLPVHAH